MKSIMKYAFLSIKEMKLGIIVLGIFIAQVLIIQSGAAAVPSFYGWNQANMSLNNTDNIAFGDFLFLQDNTSTTDIPGESILVRHWNVTSAGYSSDIFNVTNPVFGPITNDGPVFVNLTITNSTAYIYPQFSNVIHVNDGRRWISANYSKVTKYDNRSPQHPYGTITFFDTSIAKLFPEANITNWWWKWTNRTGLISDNFSGGNSFTLPLHPWLDTYTLNLTVKNSQGNLVSMSRDLDVPPDNVHPVANFTATPVAGYTPLNVSVIDQSRSLANYTMTDIAVTYEYQIGNSSSPNIFGKTFTTQNLNITLQNPGIYNITQKVTNVFGISDTTTLENIVVYPPPPPDADFSASPRSGNGPLEVDFISLVDGIGPFTYEWDYGDNSPKGFEPHPVHTYSGTDVYNVTLEVTGSGGSTLVNKTGFIAVSTTPPPVADFAVAPSNGTAPLEVSFIGLANGTGTLLYTWDFGDSVGTGTGRNPSYTYSGPGLYNVTCTVSDGIKTGQVKRENCIRVLKKPDPALPQVMFAASPRSGTAPLEVAFIDQSVGIDPITWDWYFGDNTPISHLKNPVHSYETPGTYEVSLMIHASNGDDHINQTGFITVYSPEIPHADFTATPVSGAAPLNVSFIDQSHGTEPLIHQWDFGDGSSAVFTKNPEHRYMIPGNYTVNLTVSNQDGFAKAVKTSLIQVGQVSYPDAAFTASPMNGTAPMEVSFIDQSRLNPAVPESAVYSWSFGDGGVSGNQSPVHTYTVPGNYLVSMNVTHGGMSDTAQSVILVTHADDPVGMFTATPRKGSAPLNVSFIDQSKGTQPLNFKWNFGDGAPLSFLQNPVHSYQTPGLYNVTMQVSGPGGSDIIYQNEFIEVISSADPVASFIPIPRSGKAPLNVSFIDQSSGVLPLDYFWDFGDGMSSHEKGPVHEYTTAGSWPISLTITDGVGRVSPVYTDTIVVSNYSAPQAIFIASPMTGEIPLEVSFIDQSCHDNCNYLYDWDFGDGNISHKKNPVNIYYQAGTYKTNLTITDIWGVKNTSDSVNIIVLEPGNSFKASFVMVPEFGNPPQFITFIDTSRTNESVTYDWNFDDGSPHITTQNATHLFKKPREYNVRLTITGDHGIDSYSKMVYIDKLYANMTADRKTGLNPLQVLFTDTSQGFPKQWFWKFGDGSVSNEQNPTHLYTRSGMYTVSLVASTDLKSNETVFTDFIMVT